MPEVLVRLRWPDGSVQRVYSPSLVVEERIESGRGYDVGELVPLLRDALQEGSNRVLAAYGFPCSRAAASVVAIEGRGAGFDGGTVVVEGFER